MGNETSGDWNNIDFDGLRYKKLDETYTESGYVHVKHTKYVEDLPKIKNKKQVNDTLFFKNDSIRVKIVKSKFIPQKHLLAKDGKFIIKIDGKKPYGVDGDLPKTAITAIQIIVGEAIIDIPKNELDDLFQPSFVTPLVNIGEKGRIYLTMSNGDGAGGYAVGFVIKDRQFLKRYVFYGF